MTSKSRILVIGGTGYIGKFIVEASARAGHPTLLLARSSTVAAKADVIQEFRKAGVTILLVRGLKALDPIFF